MKILVLNAGSSSLKFQLFGMPEEKVLARGMVDNIGRQGCFIEMRTGEKLEKLTKIEEALSCHEDGVARVLKLISTPPFGVISGPGEIAAVGHRVVNGGERFSGPAMVDRGVIAAIDELAELSPLHNPANLVGIEAAMHELSGVPNVACFDTAFHQTMPPEVYLYPLPYEYYDSYRIRRYGAHGISHKYLMLEAAKLLGNDAPNLITCHIGSGASVCAIKAGKSYDTSMGLTPLEGLMMVTRCGSIDPAIVPYLVKKTGKSAKEIENIMNKESGLAGIGGYEGDMRLIHKNYKSDARARLARDMFVYRIKKQIGSYIAALGRVDAIVFAGGIGERADYIRSGAVHGFDKFGITYDQAANEAGRTEWTGEGSSVRLFTIPTNEELMIARDTYEAVK